ncbi:DUF4185 domain-containing protein [Candidatus Obscuribacterales bacterium]|nr:DUF4185 domain-containing protein [Candidatus Obscuribacterales bacterium]
MTPSTWMRAILVLCFGLGSEPRATAQIMDDAPTRPLSVEYFKPDQTLSKKFSPAQNAWSGADGAYSIKLNDDTAIWTFGDTFIGKVENNKRSADTKMVNNTAAIQTSQSPDLNFIWSGTTEKPLSLWRPKEPDTYYWPGDGIAIDGKLFLFLHKIKTDKTRPEPFQFRTLTDTIVRIDNPLDKPDEWRMKYAELGNDAEKLQFGTATIGDGNYVMVFCSYPTRREGLNSHPVILARIPKGSLQALKVSDFEYYCSKTVNNEEQFFWSKQPKNPKILFADGAPEMSVTTLSSTDLGGKDSGNQKLYAIVYMPPLTREIALRHANKLTGPWSEKIKLYDCPEKDSEIFQYSAKTHQELAKRPGELVITYCRNAKNFQTHFDNASVYYPQAIRVQLKRAD